MIRSSGKKVVPTAPDDSNAIGINPICLMVLKYTPYCISSFNGLGSTFSLHLYGPLYCLFCAPRWYPRTIAPGFRIRILVLPVWPTGVSPFVDDTIVPSIPMSLPRYSNRCHPVHLRSVHRIHALWCSGFEFFVMVLSSLGAFLTIISPGRKLVLHLPSLSNWWMPRVGNHRTCVARSCVSSHPSCLVTVICMIRIHHWIPGVFVGLGYSFATFLVLPQIFRMCRFPILWLVLPDVHGTKFVLNW